MKISESKRNKFTHEKISEGAKKIIFKSTATRTAITITAITITLIIIYRKNMACTREKKKSTDRNVSRGPEPPFMLKIKEEKKEIPCEKDTSVILACLGSGMKWFRKDIGEYLKEVVN